MTSDLTAFKAALAKGSGRAMILLREAKGAGFASALLEACLINPAHDPQCEADRAPWITRLVPASGELEDLFDRILAGVENWADPEGDICFPLRVLSHLAVAHPHLDRSRLLAVLEAQNEENRIELADQFIQLSGYPAFREALERIGSQWDEHCWRVEDWLKILRERDGPGIEMALETDAAADLLVARALTGEPESPPCPRGEPEPFESLREALRAGKYRWGPMKPSRPVAERLLLAEDLAAIDEARRALPYLRFFARQPLPGDPKVVLRWCNDAGERVRHFARSALERVDHQAVRAVAVEALDALDRWGVSLLKANYRPGDYALVTPIVDSEMTDFQAHGLIMDLMDILEKLSSDERRDALLKSYDKTPCSLCRGNVVAALARNGGIPAWMAEECRFDAEPDTVALVASP